MASLLKRPLVAGSLVLLFGSVMYGRALFFTSGELRYEFVQAWGSDGTGTGEFKDPVGIAIGPSGDVYVTDTGNNRIQRFRPDGAFVSAWGEAGDALGQLDRPMHAAFGSDGYLYVAEYLNDRIQVFTEGGKAIRTLGTSGAEPGTFDAPGGVAVAGGPDGSVSQPASRLDPPAASTWPTFITPESRSSLRPGNCSVWLAARAISWHSLSARPTSRSLKTVLSTSSTLVVTE